MGRYADAAPDSRSPQHRFGSPLETGCTVDRSLFALAVGCTATHATLRTMAANDLPLRDSHHYAFNDFSLPQHRHSRNRFPHMVHTAPFLYRILSPRLISPTSAKFSQTSYPVIGSLHALLALIISPLEDADDVSLLIHGAKRMAQSADGGRLGHSANEMYSFAPSNVPPTTNLSPEDLDLIGLWQSVQTKKFSPSALAQLPTHRPQPSLAPPSAPLKHCPLSQIHLRHSLPSNAVYAGGTGRDGPIQSAQAVHKTRKVTLERASKVFAFLSKLGEWEIEFKTIKAETPHAFHIHLAALETE
ncbi:hypothetical protein M422DRAFT_275729 [Sphaerobolus stellatus SS14]|uniref:Uncharacterized protein n=1 Tax=Sphaerobolus stellatus (strain SS14) TaxID=990650 RepID=A0A0C9UEJ3_SPHS4|nr:hypothetical protein M422DRAFT_275729 [Sphaerobolus stellatus SS14]